MQLTKKLQEYDSCNFFHIDNRIGMLDWIVFF